ncbi:MAG: hypothetical protein H0T42_13585, partial [Deltaproteobacteria bacterium]|nr:hypothetical protein [Deltaproteobacteria bacterium]
ASSAHHEAIGAARSAVRKLAVFPRVEQAVGAERAESVTVLLIAIAERLAPERRGEVAGLLAEAEHDESLAAEIASLRDQLGALWTILADADVPRSI